jgi:CheY-like chemotaxis protein
MVSRRAISDPVQFLTEVKASSPKLIVLDLALGQTDAIEIIRKLEVIKYEGKLLLMSGHDESVLVKIKQIGVSRGLAMVPPLHKPFRANDLKRSLEAPVEISCAPVKAQNSPVKPVAVDLAEALANRWLELWYQPKIDLNSMKICSAEALARVRHPKHGIVLPASFLPAANDPVYLPLTKFVIQQALATSFTAHDDVHGNAVVTFPNDGRDQITLVGVHSSDLHASDFQFV